MKEFYHSKKKKTRKWKLIKKKIERWKRKRNVLDFYDDQLRFCSDYWAMKYYYQNYHFKKKKIRGWKRHKKNVERWRQNVIDLDMDYFRKRIIVHDRVRERKIKRVGLSKHPYNRSVLNSPPNWYKQICLSEMIDVYLSWYEKMAKESDDFYLKIWLYEPNFLSSHIRASFKYKDTYLMEPIFPINPVTKIFPLHKFESLKDKLALFDWEAHINTYWFWESELDSSSPYGAFTEAEVNELRNKTYEIEKYKGFRGNNTEYKVNVGDVWVGTLKKGEITK